MNIKFSFKIIIIAVIICIVAAIAIPYIINRLNEPEIHTDQQYERMYHQLDSMKNQYTILENKYEILSETNKSLENAIKNTTEKTVIITYRKNEKLRIINNSTPSELDSIMSTIHFNTNDN